MLSYFWMAGEWEGLNETIFTIYIDDKYEIIFQYYLGMGIGFGQEDAWGIPLMGKGATTSSVYNTYKIPFQSSVRVTARLSMSTQSKQEEFWFVIRGLAGLSQVNLNGYLLPDGATLQLYRVENLYVKPFEFVDLFTSNNSGAVLQVTMMGQSGNTHFMEGCMRSYSALSTDNYQDPFTLLSSGTEDYFSSAWGFRETTRTSLFHFPGAGLTHISKDHGTMSAYKIHTDDPLIFSKKKGGIRMNWRNGDTVDLLTGAKCADLNGYPKGLPTDSVVTFYVWVYEW